MIRLWFALGLLWLTFWIGVVIGGLEADAAAAIAGLVAFAAWLALRWIDTT